MIRELITWVYDEAGSKLGLLEDSSLVARLLEDIDYFGVGPQLYVLLRQSGKLERLPSVLANQLAAWHMSTLHQNVWFRVETERVLKRFESEGIEVILLKGVRFAESCFGHLGSRATSDIDLLVREEDIGRAAACLHSMDFCIEHTVSSAHFHTSYSKLLPGIREALSVELHWNLLTKGTSSLRIADFWASATPAAGKQFVKELALQFEFYMICLHGWRHAMDSMKYVLDIAQMIHRYGDQISYPDLMNTAKRDRTLRRIRSTLSIVYQLLPGLERRKPFRQYRRKVIWWRYESTRYRGSSRYTDYFRLGRYMWFEHDSFWHSITAVRQYIRSIKIFGRGGEMNVSAKNRETGGLEPQADRV